MPKLKPSTTHKLNTYVTKYPDFKTDGKVLFCKVCNKAVSADRIFTIKQHLESTKHNLLKNSSIHIQIVCITFIYYFR